MTGIGNLKQMEATELMRIKIGEISFDIVVLRFDIV